MMEGSKGIFLVGDDALGYLAGPIYKKYSMTFIWGHPFRTCGSYERFFDPSHIPSFAQIYAFRVPSVYSTWWKFGPYFVYIFITDWNFLTKFCSSDPSFNGNILTSLYLKSETFAYAQLCDYSFILTLYRFHGMVLVARRIYLISCVRMHRVFSK